MHLGVCILLLHVLQHQRMQRLQSNGFQSIGFNGSVSGRPNTPSNTLRAFPPGFLRTDLVQRINLESAVLENVATGLCVCVCVLPLDALLPLLHVKVSRLPGPGVDV